MDRAGIASHYYEVHSFDSFDSEGDRSVASHYLHSCDSQGDRSLASHYLHSCDSQGDHSVASYQGGTLLSEEIIERESTLVSCDSIGDRSVEEIMAPTSMLPSYLKPKPIMMFAEMYAAQRQACLPLMFTAGGAIPIASLLCIGRTLFFPFYVLLVMESSSCDGSAYSSYTQFTWFAWFPMLLSCLAGELYIYRSAAVPSIQVTRGFCCFKRKVPFAIWLLGSMGVSALMLVDTSTDSAFLGLQIHVGSCAVGPELENLWVSLWPQPMFGIPGLIPGLTNTCVLVWIVSFLPLVWAMLYSLPKRFTGSVRCEVNMKDVINRDQLLSEHTHATTYETWLEKDQNHGTALMALASVNGMWTLCDDDFRFAFSNMKLIYQAKADGYQIRCADYLSKQLSGMARVLGFASLVRLLSLQLQVTVLEFRFIASDNARHYENNCGQALLSISTSAIVFLFDMYRARNIVGRSTQWYFQLKNMMPPEDSAEENEFHRRIHKIGWSILILSVFMAAGCCFTIYAAVRCIGILYCGGTWHSTICPKL